MSDLSKYDNQVVLVNNEIFDINETTSNVDEGEPGKVRPLYDLVLKRDVGDDERGGIMIEVSRGSSLDVGMLHSSLNHSRQRATLEFWFYVPEIPSEIVLARRSICQPEEELQDLCCAERKEGMLWELVALPSGRLQFRTNGGSIITSDYIADQNDTNEFGFDPDDAEESDKGMLSLPKENGYGGWNHVCVSFSCQDLDTNKCNISLTMAGSFIASSDVSFQLPGVENDEVSDFDHIDNLLERSALLFGLSGVEGLRFTELRFWACKRASEDIKMMMHEYLDVAKTKKRFKVAIRSKGITKGAKGNILMPPRSAEKKPKAIFDRPLLPLPGTARRPQLDVDTSQSRVNETVNSFADFLMVTSADDKEPVNAPPAEDASKREKLKYEEDADFGSVTSADDEEPVDTLPSEDFSTRDESMDENDAKGHNFDLGAPSDESGWGQASLVPVATLSVQESPLISQEIKKSAASALIRGPPATRHFGGNRGGLHFTEESR